MGAVKTEEGKDWVGGDKKSRSRPEEGGTRKDKRSEDTSKLAYFTSMDSALLHITKLESFYNSCLTFMSYFPNQYGLLRG